MRGYEERRRRRKEAGGLLLRSMQVTRMHRCREGLIEVAAGYEDAQM
jgi:hypothetical protein